MNKTQFKLFSRFFKYVLPYRRQQTMIFFLTNLSVLLGLVNPYLSKLIVDEAIINRKLKVFIVLGLLGTGLFIVNGLITTTKNFLEKTIRLKVSLDLNQKIFGHLQTLTLDFFQDKSTGEQMFKINYDIERAVDLNISLSGEIIEIFPRLLLILAILFYLDWQMTIFSFILVSILYLPIYYVSRRMRDVWKEIISNSQYIFKQLQEVFSHIYLIKAFAKEKPETRKYLEALITSLRVNLRNIRLGIFNDLIGGSFDRVAIGLITLFGGYQVIRGRITPGTLTAIMLYLTQLVNIQVRIGFFFEKIMLGMVSCKRLDEILEEQPKILDKPWRQKNIVFGYPRIEFKDVSFGYLPKEYLIKNLNFTINKGFVAFVGPSGCGKTTILNLILKLAVPLEGKIFIAGQNINDLDTVLLRNLIGIALQEPFLWNDSIENNIKYGRENATKEEIIRVSQLTGVDDFVRDLPRGYDSIIGENACRLSEGQKQKIAIARALIKEPKILILDEAMSSMDSESEEKIIKQIKQLPIDIVILVSHRLSTVLSCDLAYFLKKLDTMVIDQPQVLIERDQALGNLFSAQIREKLENLNLSQKETILP